MGSRPLKCLEPGVRLRAHVRHLPERGVFDVQGVVFPRGLGEATSG